MNRQGEILCWIDDLCLTEILDPSLGFDTHRTDVEEIEIKTQRDKQTLKRQRAAYAKSLEKTSRIKYEPCDRYPRDFGVGVKIVAKQRIYMDTRIDELYGRMAKVTDDFFSNGIRDYSVVITEDTNETKLWLGPAAFVNHDCEANAAICSVGGAAIVKALRKIQPGDEITINYGANYFGDGNIDCMCNSCEIKGTGHFEINDQGACMIPAAADDDHAHDNISIQEIRENLYECAVCRKKFLYKSWIALHVVEHLPKYVCDKCDLAFTRKDALERHIQIVHKKKRHTCDECLKNFSTSYGVTRHKRKTHSNENIRINCPKCTLTFGCRQDLGYHDNLIHTGLKPYRCSNTLCNRLFETPYLLHKHKAIHERRN